MNLRVPNAALPDAGLLVRRAKFRPAFVQLILGICFVFRAVCNFFDAGGGHLRTAVSDNIEGGYSFGGHGPISSPCSSDNGGYCKNEGTHLVSPFNRSRTCSGSWRD